MTTATWFTGRARRSTVSICPNGNVAAVTVKGSAIASSNRWSWAFAKNMLHGANGSQVKMVDANGVMRDNGLPDPTTPNPRQATSRRCTLISGA